MIIVIMIINSNSNSDNSNSLCIYIYIYTHMYVYIYIYIYIRCTHCCSGFCDDCVVLLLDYVRGLFSGTMFCLFSTNCPPGIGVCEFVRTSMCSVLQ